MRSCLFLLVLATALAAADQVVFDAAAKDALALLSANEADKAEHSRFAMAPDKGGPVVAVECPGSESYPGIIIAPAKPWDLAAHAWIEATVENRSDHPLAVVLRADNAGDWKTNPWNGEVATIAAGQSGTVRVWFGRSWGQPGYKLDPAKVARVLVFLSQPKQAGTFALHRVIAGGKPGEQR